MSYAKGLQEVGDGLYAYLQPDGGWGWSNAGLVVDGERTLLVDTLFDLHADRGDAAHDASGGAGGRADRHARQHARQRRPLLRQPARRRRRDRRVRADRRGDDRAAARRRWPRSSHRHRRWASSATFFLRCFGAFDFDGIELVLPHETFSGERTIRVGDRGVRLIEVGPAHTRGDTLVHAPAESVLFTGGTSSSPAPIRSPGRARCPTGSPRASASVALEPEVIVPGHGPPSETDAVRE